MINKIVPWIIGALALLLLGFDLYMVLSEKASRVSFEASQNSSLLETFFLAPFEWGSWLGVIAFLYKLEGRRHEAVASIVSALLVATIATVWHLGRSEIFHAYWLTVAWSLSSTIALIRMAVLWGHKPRPKNYCPIET